MNLKEQRTKEDSLVEKLKDPMETYSKEISNLIDKTIKGKHKVLCATDWHLWVRVEKGKLKCKKRSDFEEVVKNANEALSEDDLLIYLGDLVDGEFQDSDELKSILKTIPGHKILVLGNNDLFSTNFYKSCGFDYVVKSFVWSNIVFTHIPIKNDNQYNIHGHIHNYKTYWIPYTNQIDVAFLNGRKIPVDLLEVIASQKRYSKLIKEQPEYFDEGYENMTPNMFISIMEGFVQDPYQD